MRVATRAEVRAAIDAAGSEADRVLNPQSYEATLTKVRRGVACGEDRSGFEAADLRIHTSSVRRLQEAGMRREELSRLNRTDVQDGRVAEGIITGKGGKDRVVFFDEPALEAIRAYLAARADAHLPLYARHDDGRGRPGPRGERWRLSPQSVWGVVKKYGARVGVDVTTHHLRHLKARTLLKNGAQLAEVQDLLGHASPETTKRIYAPYTTQHLREAFDHFGLNPEEVATRVATRTPRRGSDL